MASDRQIRANRQNATKSTGPRTAEGKVNSSRNAITHGLTAQHILLDGEDAAHFKLLQCRLLTQFSPKTAMEEVLVERLSHLVWRLRRVPVFEAALLSWTAHQQTTTNGTVGVVVGNTFFSSQGGTDGPRQVSRDPHDTHRHYQTGRTLQAVLSADDVLCRLSRYELLLARQVERTMVKLEKMRSVKPLIPAAGI